LLSSFGQSSTLQTSGNMSFTFKTVTYNGNFAPKHVLAVWIEDNSGFIRTQKKHAAAQQQRLYTWIASSNQNEIDAITGSTINVHQTHTITWDCKDLNGNEVPDGDYTIWIEFTEKNIQGPIYSLTFTKDTAYQLLTPPDELNFIDIELEYTPTPGLPTSNFSVNDSNICTYEGVTFTNSSYLATSYEWDFGDGANPATGNTEGPHTVTYSTSGNKTISLTINGTITQSYTEMIEVIAQPEADFIYSFLNTYDVIFSSNSVNATTYLWDFGDGDTSTDDNPNHTYLAEGIYDVSLIAMNGDCEDTVIKSIIIDGTKIERNELNSTSIIYPNPAKGIFYIVPLNVGTKDIFVSVFDTHGKIVLKQKYEYSSSIKIDATILDAGTYFVKIDNSTQTHYKKLVIL